MRMKIAGRVPSMDRSSFYGSAEQEEELDQFMYDSAVSAGAAESTEGVLVARLYRARLGAQWQLQVRTELALRRFAQMRAGMLAHPISCCAQTIGQAASRRPSRRGGQASFEAVVDAWLRDRPRTSRHRATAAETEQPQYFASPQAEAAAALADGEVAGQAASPTIRGTPGTPQL